MFPTQELKDKMNQFSPPSAADLEKASLKNRSVLLYTKHVVDTLNKLIADSDTEEKLTSSLNQFLSENWELVRGRALSYTAIPKNELFASKDLHYLPTEDELRAELERERAALVNCLMVSDKRQ